MYFFMWLVNGKSMCAEILYDRSWHIRTWPWHSSPYLLVQSALHFLWHNIPKGPAPPHFLGFTITLRHTTRGRTPLDE
jgi:hypothetical protein